MNFKLNSRADATVIAVGCIAGVLFIAGILAVYVMSRNESDKIHDEMMQELDREDQKLDLPDEAYQDDETQEEELKLKVDKRPHK